MSVPTVFVKVADSDEQELEGVVRQMQARLPDVTVIGLSEGIDIAGVTGRAVFEEAVDSVSVRIEADTADDLIRVMREVRGTNDPQSFPATVADTPVTVGGSCV